MSVRVGIDIGGTFTDFTLVDDATGLAQLHKQLTTPEKPSRAVLEGFDTLLAQARRSPADVVGVVHGSTLVTNALIERRGASTGMLVTKGFADVLDIAFERRYDLYDLRMRLPDPLVDRRLRIEIDERLRSDGSVEVSLNPEEVERAADALIAAGVNSIAVCFLHSFTSSAHEDKAAEIIRSAYPDAYVSTSADISPTIREYERWTTATMNAYTQPVVDVYLAEIEAGFKARRVLGSFQVMTSNGGCVSVATARRYPVRMLESGPAAGILMAGRLGEAIGVANVIAYDMGGTTAKGAVIQNGQAIKAYEIEVARLHEFKRGSGLPAKIPVLDMIEIGSGGGSIARVDARGVICVGPKSAGASPGPACYDLGGAYATLTDANLVLGYYAPNKFLGGRFRLNKDASAAAIKHIIAEPLDIEILQAAWGIHEVVNEDVARAIRIHSSERGIDYRKSNIIAFGGSGPAHATRVARKLRIPRVVFPLGSGVMSAFGMLVCPPSFEVARSRRLPLKDATLHVFREMFSDLSKKARSVLSEAGCPQDQHRIIYSLDVRYVGQGYEVEINVPEESLASEPKSWLPELFEAEYRKRYGPSTLDAPLEILNFKLQASGLAPALARIHRPNPATKTPKEYRDAYFGRGLGPEPAQVLSRYEIAQGDVVIGPAFVEEDECTVVLGPDDRGTVDKLGNLIVDVSLGEVQ